MAGVLTSFCSTPYPGRAAHRRLCLAVGLLLILLVLVISESSSRHASIARRTAAEGGGGGIVVEGAGGLLSPMTGGLTSGKDEAKLIHADGGGVVVNQARLQAALQRSAKDPRRKAGMPGGSGGRIGGGGQKNADQCRVFAVGDLHGDLDNTIVVLRDILGVVGPDGRTWVGGCSTVVQVGDVVDRGGQSLAALDYLARLQKQAREDGGKLILLLGNHEILNLGGEVQYANPAEVNRVGGANGWTKLFGPNGQYRQLLDARADAIELGGGAVVVASAINNQPGLADNANHAQQSSLQHALNSVSTRTGIQVAYYDAPTRSVFVHAGLPPIWAALGVAELNRLAREQIRRGTFHDGIFGEYGPVWDRTIIYGAASMPANGPQRAAACTTLMRSLRILSASVYLGGGPVSGEIVAALDAAVEARNGAGANINLRQQHDHNEFATTTATTAVVGDGAVANGGGNNNDGANPADTKSAGEHVVGPNPEAVAAAVLSQPLLVERIVVGHTVQTGITQYCGSHLIAIDTGISHAMTNHVSAIEVARQQMYEEKVCKGGAAMPVGSVYHEGWTGMVIPLEKGPINASSVLVH